MKKNQSNVDPIKIFFLMLISLLALVVNCKPLQIQSTERTDEIIIDGQYSDWQGKLAVLTDKHLTLGFQHDDGFLYGCFITSDHSLTQAVMRQGLELWIDARGDKQKKIGIKYPLGGGERGMLNRGEANKGTDHSKEKQSPVHELPSRDLEIQLPENDEFGMYSMRDLHDTGLEIAVQLKNFKLVYELKIPLVSRDDHPFAAGVKMCDSILLTFKNPEIKMDFKGKKNERGRHPGGGGMGGPGGGMDGGIPSGGGRRGRGGSAPGSSPQREAQHSINLKLLVRLNSESQ